MKTYFTILILSALTTFLITPLVRRLAFALGAMDVPDARKIHAAPMPRLGGVAVFLGFAAPWLLLYLMDNRVAQVFQQYERQFLALLLGGLAMLIVGMVDDVQPLRALHKLCAQLAVATGLYYAGFRITEISVPFTAGAVPLGWLALPASVLWIVALTNAINLLDGIDGLVAGVTATISLALALINILTGNVLVALVTLCLAGAALGFVPYNFSPARIFLGDSGSLFMGLTMACIGTLSLFKAATATFVLVPLVLFALPLFDTTSVMLGRMRRGQHIFTPDKTHVHHRLLRLGFTQRQAATLLYAVTIFLALAAVVLSWRATPATFMGVFVVAGGLGAALAAWTLWLRRRRALHAAGAAAPPAGQASP
jgi:UDP-GlcNAc:undecaprenyl-phosphate GlcNAc-1-phosphate transferase